MTIYEQLLAIFEQNDDRIYTTGEIKSRLARRFKTNPSSVIPSDYCYNRWNHGVKEQPPILLWVRTGEYRFIGPDQPWNGEVWGRPFGTSGDRVIGECVNGVRKLYPLEAE